MVDAVAAAAGLVHDLDSRRSGGCLDLAHERSHVPKATQSSLLVHTTDYEAPGYRPTNPEPQTTRHESGAADPLPCLSVCIPAV